MILSTEYTCYKYIKLCANEYCLNPHHVEKILATPLVYVTDIFKEDKNISEAYDVQGLIKVLEDLVNVLLETVTSDKDETTDKDQQTTSKSDTDDATGNEVHEK